MNRRFVQLLLPLLLLVAVACGSREGPAAPPAEATPAAATPASAEAPPAPAAPGRPAAGTRLERVSLPTGNLDVVLLAEEPGAKYRVQDGMGRPLATLKVQADRVKAKDAGDREVRKVKRKDNGFEVEDGSGTRLFRVKVKDGGDFKVSDGSDRLVGRVKSTDGGFRVEDGAGKVLARVKAQGEEVVFLAEDGRETGVLKRTTDARAAAWFAMKPMDPITQASVVVYLLEGI